MSKDGKIATNRHVIEPIIEDTDIALRKLGYTFNTLRNEIEERISALSSGIGEINYIMKSNYLSIDEYRLCNSTIQGFEDEIGELESYRRILNIDPSKSNIVCHKKLGIAYNNSYLKKWSDFEECVVIKQSKSDIDLAIMQLKGKQTPSNCYIFDFDDHNPNIYKKTITNIFGMNEENKSDKFSIHNSLNVDDKLYMIGYNHGIEIANTTNGIKAQLTQGTVSQESDDYKVLYSIPSLQGSSGSPVINQWGNLVAINFAKAPNSQNFNYGILVKHLDKLLNK